MQPFDDNKHLFLALWPDDTLRVQIHACIPSSIDRPTRINNLHITLVFLGDIPWPVAERLIQRINRLHPRAFRITLDTIGYWSRPGILWLGMQEIPEDLLLLVKSLRKRARMQGIKVETRAYKPHVTLARKVREKPEREENIRIDWHMDRFVLVESVQVEGGVQYKVRHEWPLKT